MTVHIVNAEIPFLLSLADMDRLEGVHNNLENTLTHKPSGIKASVQRRFGYPFHSWSYPLYCFYITTELQPFQRRFGNPSAGKQYN